MTAVASLVLVWIRYAVLFLARAAGWTRRWLFGGWRRVLIAAGGVWLAVWDVTNHRPHRGFLHFVWRHSLIGGWLPASWYGPKLVIGVIMALALAFWLVRARRRWVVTSFVDYRAETPKPLPGLSSLLVDELVGLYDLYQVVDKSRADPESTKGRQSISFAEDQTLSEADRDSDVILNESLDVPAPIRAEDLSDALDSVISVEATVDLAFIKVPLGALAGIVGRIARGPRLTGSVHGLGEELVVTARTVGARKAHTWRVDTSTSGLAPHPSRQPEEVLEELAIRIFTDLALNESVKWRATWANVQGLRLYRSCLRTKKDRRLKLEEAKHRFTDAIAEDDSFELAYYDLGVVATELGHHEAAEAAFLAAIERNNARWEPHYGLAQLYFAQERYEDAAPLCDRMVQLRRCRAESYHLQALVFRRRGRCHEAMKARRAAVIWAWVRLCSAALAGREPETRLAATSLRNLAGLRAYHAKEAHGLARAFGYRVARSELRQGKFLHPSDAELYFELGKIYAAQGRFHPALRQFGRAVAIAPGRPRFWIHHARAYSHLPRRDRDSQLSVRRALEQPSQISESGFDRLIRVQRRIGDDAGAHRTTEIREFERCRRGWNDDHPTNDKLETDRETYSQQQAVWQVAQVCVELVNRYVRCGDGGPAGGVALCLQGKLEELRMQHRGEMRRQDYCAVVAEGLHAAGENQKALEHAEAAVATSPLSCRAYSVLANVHLTMNHLKEAEAAWRRALVCSPDDPFLNLRLGECLVCRALGCRDSAQRRSRFTEAAQCLENAILLLGLNVASDGGHGPEQSGTQGRAHFWLGRALFELDDYEAAITSLAMSSACGYEPLLARLRLGVAHLRAGLLSEGEYELQSVKRDAERTVAWNGDPGRLIGPPGDRLSLRELLAWARVYHAGSLIEREAELTAALQDLSHVEQDVATTMHGQRQSRGLLACAYDWEGWAYFKMGQHDDALELLVKSIECDPTAEAYLHLALVHAAQARRVGNPAVLTLHGGQARHFGALARRMGIGPEQAQQLEEALCRLND